MPRSKVIPILAENVTHTLIGTKRSSKMLRVFMANERIEEYSNQLLPELAEYGN